jgi:hypothetical protein
MLASIKVFEITPRHSLQIILGTNGSGKSSVLEEMSPVPGNKGDYIKGGKKIFECQHNGHAYVLTSHYVHGSGKHSFLKDGEELNKGETLQIQKELAFQEFGLNKERLDVLLGITRFTSMSVAKRREWLTELSPVDLNYAFSILKTVKGAKRDADGVVKHTAQRIHREAQDFPGESERQALKQRVAKLTEQLNLLFQHSRVQGQGTTYTHMSFVDSLTSSCEALKGILKGYPELPPTLQVKTAQEASEAVLGLSRDYGHLAEQLKAKQAQYLELEKQQPQDQVTYTAEDIASLKTRKEELRRTLEALPTPSGTEHFPLIELSDFPDASSYLKGVLDEWEGLMVTIPDNSTGRFSRELLQRTVERHRALSAMNSQKEDRCVTIRRRMQSLKACEAVECPKCQHSFRPGVDPNEVAALKAEYKTLIETLEKDKVAVEKDQGYIEACQEYLEYRKRFHHLSRMHPRLRDFFVVWVEKGLIQAPLTYQSEYAQWREQMFLALKRAGEEKALKTVSEQLKMAEDTQRYQNHHLKQQLNHLQGEIETLTGRVRDVQQQHQALKRTVEHMRQHEGRLNHAIRELEVLLTAPPQLLESSLVQLVQERIKELQLQLAQAQERLSKSDIQEGILRDLEAQHQAVLESQGDYALLVKTMSPNEGLIGRYLMGFMQIVVKFMNAVIARVWTHSLEILPSKVDRDELDYRFPLDVQNGAVTPPDIALGSSAQRDIVDFAFRLLMMKFLKIEHLPLYLDEMGNMFDEEHRVNLVRLIENMLEVGHTSQVFFISHYMSTHGALEKAADVCVVDDTNITVPQRYNEHVIIQ